MGWNIVVAVALILNIVSGQVIRRPFAPLATAIAPTIQPAIVDGTIVQSLIDTIQLFIVSDLLEETLPEKQKLIAPAALFNVATPCSVDYDFYDFGCDILPYPYYDYDSDIIYDSVCPDVVTALNFPPAPLCVNFGLNKELILPPLAAELPCGLGYLPGGLPVVAKAFAPGSKYSGCGCGSESCSCAAIPVCSPCSCAALSTPLCPNLSPLVKPVIL